MHALVVAPDNPFPPDSGGRLRTKNVIEVLAGAFDVDLLTNARADAGPPPANVTVRAVAATVTPKGAAIRSLYKLRNCSPISHVDAYLGDALDEMLRARAYDVVVLEHTMLGHLIERVRSAQPDTRVIIDAHNVEVTLTKQIIGSQPTLPRKMFFLLNHVFTGWNEAHAVAKSDAVLTCSTDDVRRFETLYPRAKAQMVPVPNFLAARDYNYKVPEGHHGRAPRAILFGDMQYWPNVRAAQYFHDSIYPGLKVEVPDLVWVIAGKNPLPSITALATDPSIHVTGAVPDMADEVHAADVVVVPLLDGSGTRFKILEAWALGRPVVSTTIGADGLSYTAGRELLIADTPEAFVAATAAVLRDPGLAASLAANAYETYRALYHEQAVRDRLLAAVRGREAPVLASLEECPT